MEISKRFFLTVCPWWQFAIKIHIYNCEPQKVFYKNENEQEAFYIFFFQNPNLRKAKKYFTKFYNRKISINFFFFFQIVGDILYKLEITQDIL